MIVRNLSFEEENIKVLAKNILVFRFLMLCIHCKYSTLRQLALDAMGNIAVQVGPYFGLDEGQLLCVRCVLLGLTH